MVKGEHENRKYAIAEEIFNTLTAIEALREGSISNLNDEQKNELKNPDLLVKTLGFLLSFIDEKWLPEYCLELAARYRFYSAYGKIDDREEMAPINDRDQARPGFQEEMAPIDDHEQARLQEQALLNQQLRIRERLGNGGGIQRERALSDQGHRSDDHASHLM